MGAYRSIKAIEDERRADRSIADIVVGFREQGQHRVETRLIDISRYGFRVESDAIEVDSTVWLKLRDAEPRIARVVWSDPHAAGCVFLEPLDTALLRQVLLQGHFHATLISEAANDGALENG